MKPKFIESAQLAFLQETINHFNKRNRSSANGRCLYSPLPFSEGCAIGRRVVNKRQCAEWDNHVTPVKTTGEGPEYPGVGMPLGDVFPHLGSLRALGLGFLTLVQGLHDSGSCWNERGLSAVGVSSVKTICQTCGLDFAALKIPN